MNAVQWPEQRPCVLVLGLVETGLRANSTHEHSSFFSFKDGVVTAVTITTSYGTLAGAFDSLAGTIGDPTLLRLTLKIDPGVPEAVTTIAKSKNPNIYDGTWTATGQGMVYYKLDVASETFEVTATTGEICERCASFSNSVGMRTERAT